MIPPVSSIRSPQVAEVAAGVANPRGSAGGSSDAASFEGVLKNALTTVDQMQKDAHNSVDRFLSGEDEDLHKVALDQQRASLAFEMFMQVRNKAVSAYQEVMRMQL
jgi:flagellar hook-basal body complex protein FliE